MIYFPYLVLKKIISINFTDYKVSVLPNMIERFSRFYPSMQKQLPLLSIKEVNQKSWRDGAVRWYSEKLTQSISLKFSRREISKYSLPVDGFYGYSWYLYDGIEKVYEGYFISDKDFSFNIFSLPHTLWADRLALAIDGKSSTTRRIGRPILE